MKGRMGRRKGRKRKSALVGFFIRSNRKLMVKEEREGERERENKMVCVVL